MMNQMRCSIFYIISLKLMINVQSPPESTKCQTHLGGGGGGGNWDFANPTHATIPTARIIHPNMSYLRSLLFFFFKVVCNRREKDKLKSQMCQLIKNINNIAKFFLISNNNAK